LNRVLFPLRMRPSERLFVCYFAYVAIISGFFRDRPQLHAQPVFYLLASTAFFLVLKQLQRGRLEKPIAALRDWLPIAFLIIAFREMELFVPTNYNLVLESGWIKLDRIVLRDWGWRTAVESRGVTLPFYLELCYLLVYGLAAFSLAWIAVRPDPRRVDYFWTVYLTGTLIAYALFPYFPSLPPRYAFPLVEPPAVTSWVRVLNHAVLRDATIHSGVFPSAHVSSAFSAVWALYFIFPRRRWFGHIMLIYAISVSVATVYGRYHYVADVLGGFAVSLIALGVAFSMRSYVQKH
jgi:membrane-associated phospholipid phosphatase